MAFSALKALESNCWNIVAREGLTVLQGLRLYVLKERLDCFKEVLRLIRLVGFVLLVFTAPQAPPTTWTTPAPEAPTAPHAPTKPPQSPLHYLSCVQWVGLMIGRMDGVRRTVNCVRWDITVKRDKQTKAQPAPKTTSAASAPSKSAPPAPTAATAPAKPPPTNASSAPPGHYCGLGTKTPTILTAGLYSPLSGLVSEDQAFKCPPGFYCDAARTEIYKGYLCSPGYYCPAGSTTATQTKCPYGTWSDESGLYDSSQCNPCPRGYTCTEAATTLSGISPCPVGSYCPEYSKSNEANYCPDGTYSPVTKAKSQADCLPCLPGKFCV